MACDVAISAMMHPKDQISIGFAYLTHKIKTKCTPHDCISRGAGVGVGMLKGAGHSLV